jgi:pyridoxamine 5'-phosphate oxidase
MTANSDPFSPEAADPLPCFRAWFAEARLVEPNDPDATALATATPTGLPSVRMVLLKEITADGSFLFYTNTESRKGAELASNPHAALCFHWKSMRRQVRIEGAVSEIAPQQADAYFHSRPRGSQLGAMASNQSRPLADRATLETRAAELARLYPGNVPRPRYWTGCTTALFTCISQTDGDARCCTRRPSSELLQMLLLRAIAPDFLLSVPRLLLWV